MREGRPYSANEEDDSSNVANHKIEAPKQIGHLMDRFLLRPPEEAEAPPDHAEGANILEELADDDNDLLVEKKRARKIARFLPRVIKEDDVAEPTPALFSDHTAQQTDDVDSATDNAHDYSLYVDNKDTYRDERFTSEVEGAQDYPHSEDTGESNIEQGIVSDEHAITVSEQVNELGYTDLPPEILAAQGQDSGDVDNTSVGGNDNDANGSENLFASTGNNLPPGPPGPPSPPGFPEGRDGAGFNNDGSSGILASGYNDAASLSAATRNALPKPVEQINGRRDNLGLLALATAVFVHFRARAREAKIVRNQNRKNKELEGLVDKKVSKASFDQANRRTDSKSSDPRQPLTSPHDTIPQPVVIQKLATEKNPSIIPIPFEKPRPTESVSAQRDIASSIMTVNQIAQEKYADKPSAMVGAETRGMAPAPLPSALSSSAEKPVRNEETPRESIDYNAENKDTPALEAKQAVLNPREVETLVDERLNEHGYEKIKRHAVPAMNAGSVESTQNSGPVVGLDDSSYDRGSMQGSGIYDHGHIDQSPSNLNREYAKTGFVAAVIIVFGVVLLMALR